MCTLRVCECVPLQSLTMQVCCICEGVPLQSLIIQVCCMRSTLPVIYVSFEHEQNYGVFVCTFTINYYSIHTIQQSY